jgi:hypothetical protein
LIPENGSAGLSKLGGSPADHEKSPMGILIAVFVVVVVLGWIHLRRAKLIEQGTTEMVRSLEPELPAEYMRRVTGTPDPQIIEQLREVEVVSFSPS